MGSSCKGKVKPGLQQLMFLEALCPLQQKRGCVAKIADQFRVNHGIVSRFFNECMAAGYLTDEHVLTPTGNVWLSEYRQVSARLRKYLAEIGVPGHEREAELDAMLSHLDLHTLTEMTGREEHRQNPQRPVYSPQAAGSGLPDQLEEGCWEIDFHFYPVREPGEMPAVFDQWFGHPALLRCSVDISRLELTQKAAGTDSSAEQVQRALCLQYEYDSVIYEAACSVGGFHIPLEVCRFREQPDGSARGILPVILSGQSGGMPVPEQTALLVFWL